MTYPPPQFSTLSEMSAIDVGRLTEDEARIILKNIRWPNGPVCPHCNGTSVTRLNSDPKKSTRDGVFQCNECREQFTVMVGTIMEGSHITLRQWVQAFHSMCSHRQGVSALQLKRSLGLGSYRSAWHLAHRIRLAMRVEPLASSFKGTVDVDGTYVWPQKVKVKRGRGTGKKTIVAALVERHGRVRSEPAETISVADLKGAIREKVDKSARMMTDELPSFRGIGQGFEGGHETVSHRDGE